MLFGGVLLVIGLGFAESAGQLFAIIPIGAVGALLIIAGTDLALSCRLFDGRPSCWPVIGITALLTVVANPAVGLAGGWLAELCRSAIVRTIARRFS
jgi:MFS superfamily sulfate permease-like transporter